VENHCFCRVKLKLTVGDVRKVHSSQEIQRAWMWGNGRTRGHQSFEFHGPNDEYDYNLRQADCKWSALAEGWQRLLDRRTQVDESNGLNA
jgi:hypothetical protein